MVRNSATVPASFLSKPPGGLVKEGQAPGQSAREELEEETGYQAEELELLGWMHPMPAIFTNRFHVYLARNATPTGRLNPDETEEIETVLVPSRSDRGLYKIGPDNLFGADRSTVTSSWTWKICKALEDNAGEPFGK